MQISENRHAVNVAEGAPVIPKQAVKPYLLNLFLFLPSVIFLNIIMAFKNQAVS